MQETIARRVRGAMGTGNAMQPENVIYKKKGGDLVESCSGTRSTGYGSTGSGAQGTRTRDYYRLNTPPARRRDWMGCTTTSEMPSPTVSPIDTEISWRAVWNPDRYDSDDEEPDVSSDTNEKRPPFARPDGSWNRMPVICAKRASQSACKRAERSWFESDVP